MLSKIWDTIRLRKKIEEKTELTIDGTIDFEANLKCPYCKQTIIIDMKKKKNDTVYVLNTGVAKFQIEKKS